MAVAQDSQVYRTGNMALVAFLLMRGYDARRMLHTRSNEVQWEYVSDDELEQIVDSFEYGVVSVNMPTFWQLFSKVRDEMYGYLRDNNLRRTGQT